MSQLEILEVWQERNPVAGIERFWIDAPVAGTLPLGVLRLEGWIRGTDRPLGELRLFCEGSMIRTLPIDIPRPDVAGKLQINPENLGFATMLTALELPGEFELRLKTSTREGQWIPIATLKGRQALPAPADGDCLQPLLVTSLGRTGTTYLMRLLAQHPGIVIDQVYPYETNAAAYWMHLVRVLTQPQLTRGIPAPVDRGTWNVPPFAAPPATHSPALAEFTGRDYPALVATFCRNAAEAFYRGLAASQGRTQAVYYCEKLLPNGLHPVFNNLYSRAREICLVRDFRDVATSIFAFNAKRGVASFGRETVGSDQAYIPKLYYAAERLLNNLRARRGRMHLVRYEDLIRRPLTTIGGILEYLGLPVTESRISEFIRGAVEDESLRASHCTTASPQESIGRWSRDLDPEMQRICRDWFDEILPQFGYQLDSQGMLCP